MKRLLKALLTGLLLGTAACLTVLEVMLAVGWLRGKSYIMRYGAAENPYAAEDTEITGLLALLLLPLVLAALAGSVSWIMLRHKTRARDARLEK